ncbi:hypothetical protein [Heyndrickxia vini]|uniref:Uncharacterized protein n=1 Tax=Heyndrickxia vini TaxID=1476025 RepID=A0ABX7E6D8_9BACI|nr:hypothetical protein [Heyndrickxia vini]QQZ11319.1 hypothetical protein I5776_10715 [Heyndrickxia vini]
MRKQDVIFAWLGSIISILFFIIVNFLTSPNYHWFIYPSFFLLLWPLSMYSIKYGNYKVHSVMVSALIILFLLAINVFHSPEHPWILYAWYPIIWWPILMFLEKKRSTVSIGIVGSVVTIVYYSTLNILLSPSYPWAIYPIFAVLWWPMAVYYSKMKDYFKFSISASILIIIFFITVNMVSSPHEIWAVYPIFVTLWWPLSMYYYYYCYRAK